MEKASSPEKPIFVLKRKWTLFAANLINGNIPIQEPTHVGAKLRDPLLERERGIFLVIGQSIATCSDIDFLFRTISKDQHLLRDGDINQNDKINYDGVERLSNPKKLVN